MSLTLGRQGGIAQPLKKRTVGQTNIAHVYDGANHIWPTSVIHFSDFTSVQLRYIWGSDDGRDLNTKSYYVNSPINSLNYIAVGWSWNLSQIPYLYWGLYQWALTQQNQRFEDRERLNSELFGVYIDGRNRTDALIEKNNTDHFNLYKYTRDADDDIRKELSDLKAELAVTKAIRPYQDKLIQCEMEKMFTAGINYTDRKTCNVIYGVVTLPNEPTVTGLVGRNAYGCLPCGFTQPASGTPAQ